MLRSLKNRVIQKIESWKDFALEDISASDNEIIRTVKNYTMTSPERIYAMLEAVRYVLKRNLPGSIVECGVWRGGMMMAVARLLQLQGSGDKDLYLFDTFEGMPKPDEDDIDFRGRGAEKDFITRERMDGSSDWCYATLADVRSNLESVGYENSKLHYIVGRVEDTIPEKAPDEISVLRLDTDWYKSTKHELIHLYPRLVPGGVLIIDDYGHWQGARKAVDEYMRERGIQILLNRIDYTGRVAIKH